MSTKEAQQVPERQPFARDRVQAGMGLEIARKLRMTAVSAYPPI